jgi:hypothetical protein
MLVTQKVSLALSFNRKGKQADLTLGICFGAGFAAAG